MAQKQELSAPAQTFMEGFGDSILVKQHKVLLEAVCDIEAKNKYAIHSTPGRTDEGVPQMGWIREESQCLERICCNVNRSLTFIVHQGDKTGPVALKFKKPFSCTNLPLPCIMRPEFDVVDDSDASIGKVYDPCNFESTCLCTLNQDIFGADGQPKFKVKGCVCQPGIICPCLCDMEFNVYKPEDVKTPVGKIYKLALSCTEICCKTNRFKIDFPPGSSNVDKALLLASSMLLDMAYFEDNGN